MADIRQIKVGSHKIGIAGLDEVFEEVRSRGGHVIAVATEGDEDIERHCEAVFHVPNVSEPLQPMLTVVPLQLLAYHAAVIRGKDVDKPRNLAKSVTVE